MRSLLMNKSFVIGNSRQRLMQVISLLSNFLINPQDDYELVLRKRVYKRSTEQNKRYWALLNEISEGLPVQGVAHSAEAWHHYFRQKFIGSEDLTLPTGKVFSQPISTTTLDIGSFGEYMTQIESWAAGHGLLFSEDRMAA